MRKYLTTPNEKIRQASILIRQALDLYIESREANIKAGLSEDATLDAASAAVCEFLLDGLEAFNPAWVGNR